MEYNYKKLSDLQTRINRLNHLKEVAFWDQATNMSEKGLNARSEAIAELSQMVHELECDPNNKNKRNMDIVAANISGIYFFIYGNIFIEGNMRYFCFW